MALMELYENIASTHCMRCAFRGEAKPIIEHSIVYIPDPRTMKPRRESVEVECERTACTFFVQHGGSCGGRFRTLTVGDEWRTSDEERDCPYILSSLSDYALGRLKHIIEETCGEDVGAFIPVPAQDGVFTEVES